MLSWMGHFLNQNPPRWIEMEKGYHLCSCRTLPNFLVSSFCSKSLVDTVVTANLTQTILGHAFSHVFNNLIRCLCRTLYFTPSSSTLGTSPRTANLHLSRQFPRFSFLKCADYVIVLFLPGPQLWPSRPCRGRHDCALGQLTHELAFTHLFI